MPFANLIFDLDGTLVDSLPGIEFSVDATLAAHELPARTSSLRSLIGPPIRSILGTVAGPTANGELSAMEQSFRRSYDAVGWQKTVLFEGARLALERAHAAGRNLFIATNKPAKVTALILDRLQIRPLFTEVVCRDSSQPPHASKLAMLLALIHRRNLKLEESLFVGDTSEDYQAGAEAGIRTVIASHGYNDSGLTRYPGYLRIDSFEELQF